VARLLQGTNADGTDPGSAKVKFHCTNCPYSAAKKEQLRTHGPRHDGFATDQSSPGKCPYCDYVCLAPHYLTAHRKRHFSKSKMVSDLSCDLGGAKPVVLFGLQPQARHC
jgi:hypothetical protein